MAPEISANRWVAFGLWAAIAVYAAARVCQIYADSLPILLIVLLHVIPPALLAMIHGGGLYGRRGVLAFTAICLGTAALFESLSLRTGFPFGRYHFTGVMGPKLFGLPFLLALAYLGIGYCSWILALLILRYQDTPLRGTRIFSAPMLASFIMLAWDLSMDPQWATIDRAWIWEDGGAFFGVPVSNFRGWYLTAFLFFLAFAVYLRSRPPPAPISLGFWRAPIAMYAVCALGNLLIRPLAATPLAVADASGRIWRSADVRDVCYTVSLLVLTPFALLAWLRLREQAATGCIEKR
ncbi:putative membrane protein [Granulicella aggregans]|uniref:Putative membrane protein n=1 Tax=Granulicella aggregans TaxID=474949 RepID=A0A7W8E2E8_9BACT|nr:carotenoid biosynthesis protein [Granulicella aggregans]MBB5056808.1 putative membrane protein [Granulicella aggregans]